MAYKTAHSEKRSKKLLEQGLFKKDGKNPGPSAD